MTDQSVRRSAAIVVFVAVLVPTAAWAQGTIAGVVRDGSGAVLPGVTVAASPVLIEELRSMTTDDTGQYRIVDLRRVGWRRARVA